jgi:hypothetical protein
MSKALTYDEAEMIIKACVAAELPVPCLRWFMGKRRPENWQPIIEAAQALMLETDVFRWALEDDVHESEERAA